MDSKIFLDEIIKMEVNHNSIPKSERLYGPKNLLERHRKGKPLTEKEMRKAIKWLHAGLKKLNLKKEKPIGPYMESMRGSLFYWAQTTEKYSKNVEYYLDICLKYHLEEK